jgi:hypothetical protein
MHINNNNYTILSYLPYRHILIFGKCCINVSPYQYQRITISVSTYPYLLSVQRSQLGVEVRRAGVIQSEAAAVAPPVLASQSSVVRSAKTNGLNRIACIDGYSGRSLEAQREAGLDGWRAHFPYSASSPLLLRLLSFFLFFFFLFLSSYSHGISSGWGGGGLSPTRPTSHRQIHP